MENFTQRNEKEKIKSLFAWCIRVQIDRQIPELEKGGKNSERREKIIFLAIVYSMTTKKHTFLKK